MVLRIALVFCLGVLIPRQAFADHEPIVELPEGATECLKRDQLEAAVVAELGSTEVPSGLRVEVQVADDAGFTLRDGETVVAERRFESLPEDCHAQEKMLAVVIALAIEHKVSNDAEKRAETSQPPTVATEPPVPKANTSDQKSRVLPTGDDADAKLREKKKGWGLRGSGSIGYSFGVLPVPAPVVSGELGVVVWRGWSAEIGVIATERVRIGFDVEVPDGSGLSAPDEAFSQALVQLLAGKAQGCFERGFEKGALGICGGLAVGRFHARGVEGFQPSVGEGIPWAAGFSRFTGRAPARGPFGATLNADIFAHFIRPGVELTGVGSVRRPVDTPVAGGVVSFGLFFVVE